jgi:hypothetical protein
MFEVVNRVAIPPRMVPKAIGISSREGATRVWRESAITAGISTPAAAMLFMNSESMAEASTVTSTSRGSFRPAMRTIWRLSSFVMPDCCNPSETTEIARMVITAEPPNPLNASRGVTSPVRPNTARVKSAIRSGRRRP